VGIRAVTTLVSSRKELPTKLTNTGLTCPPKTNVKRSWGKSKKEASKMPRKQFTLEQIITKLREAEVLMSQDMTVIEAVCQLEISKQTYYCLRKEYGGLDTDPS